MRVVLDTNVLVSGTFWTGASFEILQLIDQGKVTLLLSKEILEEYDRVVQSDEILEKTAYCADRISAVRCLLAMATWVTPTSRVQMIQDDPDDDKFLDAALAGMADIIVSQDHHLLTIKEFKGIVIMTPQDFMASARQDEGRACPW